MRFILLIAGLFILNCSAKNHLQIQWEDFKTKYGKKYNGLADDAYRYQLWLETVQRIEEHNKRYEAGDVSYTLGLNKMSDFNQEEKSRIRGLMAAKKLNSKPIKKSYKTSSRLITQKRPDQVDWRTDGAVNPIITNEGSCKASWAFSAVAAIESQLFITKKTDVIRSLSAQQLIDCCPYTDGCSGGDSPALAFQYLDLKEIGLETEESYPYQAKDQVCQYNRSRSAIAPLLAYKIVPQNDEDGLQASVATIGPISVMIDASGKDFLDYSSGVYVSTDCKNGLYDVNLALLVVGYGTTEDNQEYYIARNSWGEEWGEQGYIRLARNKGNMCGIATQASYPIVSLK